MTAPVRKASLTATLDGAPALVDAVSWDYGVSLSGDPGGMSGRVDWTPGATLQHPSAAGFAPVASAPVTVDWADEQGTARVVTARIADTRGGTGEAASSSLTDWLSRLATEIELRPMAWTLPRRQVGTTYASLPRQLSLFGVWFTEQAMRAGGFFTSSPPPATAVWHQSMCGSAACTPDPESTFEPLGDITQAYRIGSYGDVSTQNAAPMTVTGDWQPVLTGVDVLGFTTTRRNTASSSWRLTVDLGTTNPTVGDIGRAHVGPTASETAAAIGLDWTQTLVRVMRITYSGGVATRTVLGSLARATGGVYAARWSVVVTSDGTVTLVAEDQRQLVITGVTHGLPIDGSRAAVSVESPGRIGPVIVARSSGLSPTWSARTGRIQRESLSAMSLPAFDFVPRTQAGRLLADQADAERGWRGLPIWQWIDQDGVLNNADFSTLAAKPIAHTIRSTSDAAVTTLDSTAWEVSSDGPYRAVTVRSRWAWVTIREHPTILLAQGSRETMENYERLDQWLHPGKDNVWLDIDTRPRMAGHLYSAMDVPASFGKDLARERGTWVGGSRVDSDSSQTSGGWMTIDRFTDWTMGSDGYVNGALQVIDPRTVLISSVVTPGADSDPPVVWSMSTMPPPGGTLPEYRKSQPLPQLRGAAQARFYDRDSTTTVTGNQAHQVFLHDCGMWVQQGPARERIASELVAGLTTPVQVRTVTCALNPRVRVGQVVRVLEQTGPTTWANFDGVVARVAGRSDADEMQLQVVVVNEWTTAPSGFEPHNPLFSAPEATFTAEPSTWPSATSP